MHPADRLGQREAGRQDLDHAVVRGDIQTVNVPALAGADAGRRALGRMGVLLAIAAAPVLGLPGAVSWLDGRHPALDVGATPAAPGLVAMMWGVLALGVVGGVWAFLLPGLLLAGAGARASSFAKAMLVALCVGVPGWAVVTQVATGAGIAPGGLGFRVLVVATAAGSFVAARWRVARRSHVPPWVGSAETRVQILVTSMVVFALTLLLGPRLMWQDLSGDGAHMFEATRLLTLKGIPFWGRGWVGGMSSWPGINTVAFLYPAAWHMYLVGTVDAAVRLPFFLYLGVVPFGVVALASVRTTKRVGAAALLLAWLCTVVYAVTVAYSAGYDEYTVDIALPSAQDTMFIVSIMAFLVGFLDGEFVLLLAGLLLSLLGLPSGIQIALLWIMVAAVLLRPIDRRMLVSSVVCLTAFVLAQLLVPRFHATLGLPVPGGEHGLASLARYYGVLQLTDVRRLLFVIVPGGILPALALVWWGTRDRVAAAIAALTACYFLAFYVQGATQLHYYVPAMVLPIAVHVRGLTTRPSRRWTIATALAGVVALVVSWPPYIDPVTTLRAISGSVVLRLPGYDTMTKEYFTSTQLLSALFTSPTSELAQIDGTALALQRHARRQRSVDEGVRYVVQRTSDPAPPGFTERAARDSLVLYARDDGRVPFVAALKVPPAAAAPIYRIPWAMRLSGRLKGAPGVWDIRHRLARLLKATRAT